MSSMKKLDLSLIVYKLNRTYQIFSGNLHKCSVRNRVPWQIIFRLLS